MQEGGGGRRRRRRRRGGRRRRRRRRRKSEEGEGEEEEEEEEEEGLGEENHRENFAIVPPSQPRPQPQPQTRPVSPGYRFLEKYALLAYLQERRDTTAPAGQKSFLLLVQIISAAP